MNEQENTFRILTEEPLLVTSFWCRFGWHNWTKYKEPEKVREKYDDYVIQQRRCAACNTYNRKRLYKL